MHRQIALGIAGLAGIAALVSARATKAPAAVVPAAVEPPAAPAVVSVTGREYAIDAPDTLRAGVTTLRFTGAGKELHHLWVVRLEQGKTLADFAAAMKAGETALPAWVHALGGPNAALPGVASEATVALTPGNYLLLCVIPAADGTPHVMKGMVRPLVVVPNVSRAAMPAADITMRLADYGFALSKPLTAGKHLIRVTNQAKQAHEVLLVRLAPGKTIADFLAWIEKPQGAPPAAPMGGTVGMATGEANVIAVDLPPGEYGLICFWPDATDGKPHFMHGMQQQVTVR